jgi:hypothetical protein
MTHPLESQVVVWAILLLVLAFCLAFWAAVVYGILLLKDLL